MRYQQPQNRRKTHWVTWSAATGWPIDGLKFTLADVAVPLPVTRTAKTSLKADGSAPSGTDSPPVLCAGDLSGNLTLTRFPSYKSGRLVRQYNAHSRAVTALCFSSGNELLLSTGGGDSCVLQWKTHFDEMNALAHARMERSEILRHVAREKGASLKGLERAVKEALLPPQRKKRQTLDKTERLKGELAILKKRMKDEGEQHALIGCCYGRHRRPVTRSN